MTRALTLAAGAVLLLGAVVGCSDSGSGSSSPSSTSASPSTTPSPSATTSDSATTSTKPADWNYVAGLPDGIVVPSGAVMAGAGWSEGGTLWVLTFGSSSNPDIVKKVTADGQALTLAVESVDPGGMATADYMATTSYIEVPDTVDRSAPVEITITGIGTLTVTADDLGWIYE